VEKIRLEILGLSSSQTQPGSYALVLSETNGSRRLPIIIGSFEAQAIALEMENIKPNRPMTHDLFKAMAQEFGLSMRELVITSLHEGVFYSKIYMSQNGVLREIDARPSDAIALAVRFKAPIFVVESVMREAGIDYASLTERSTEASAPVETETQSSGISLEERRAALLEKINEAIRREDYEEAARLRDQINNLE
jgi:bifunctional DNase/RNase